MMDRRGRGVICLPIHVCVHSVIGLDTTHCVNRTPSPCRSTADREGKMKPRSCSTRSVHVTHTNANPHLLYFGRWECCFKGGFFFYGERLGSGTIRVIIVLPFLCSGSEIFLGVFTKCFANMYEVNAKASVFLSTFSKPWPDPRTHEA